MLDGAGMGPKGNQERRLFRKGVRMQPAKGCQRKSHKRTKFHRHAIEKTRASAN